MVELRWHLTHVIKVGVTCIWKLWRFLTVKLVNVHFIYFAVRESSLLLLLKCNALLIFIWKYNNES